jgi:hypothetical protein
MFAVLWHPGGADADGLEPAVLSAADVAQVVLPDQLLESVFSGYYEIYMYEFSSKDEVTNMNNCLYNLGTRAVLLRMLQEQQMFDVRMVYDKKVRTNGVDYELVLEFHRRPWPTSPRLSACS